jgi:phenylalanyl-tRNA synthetase beta chain
MKISYKWLRDYIDINDSIDDLSAILTDIGLEVEGVDEVETVKGGLEGVVVGRVVERDKHPNADRLSTTMVDIGNGEIVPIVCGASNVRAGLNVLVATVGTTLYDGEGKPWKIKKGKIRGEESHGMICAEDELGLGSSHEGIMELPEDAPVGQPAAEYLNIQSDHVFDIGLTPNRSDATGHLGVAKDLLAYVRFHRDSNAGIVAPQTMELAGSDRLKIQVEVRDTQACPRYSGICFDNIQVGSSPQWLQDRLNVVGVRPINNVVDITNYIMLEYGQPLHAFDYDKIDGQKVIVAKLEDGTRFKSLDEVERELSAGDLMICDGKAQPMCIAGVFGGLDSGVTGSTKRIFLESAHFEAIGVRKTSTRHLLHTDSARCFEKGSDPNITVEALKRAAFLLKEYAGAEVASDLIDEYPDPIDPTVIKVEMSYIQRLLGKAISSEEVVRALEAMDMGVSAEGNELRVEVPTNKADVKRPADIAEEVLRIYGMNNIEIDERLEYNFAHKDFGSMYRVREQIADHLAATGYSEAMGLSLVNDKMYSGREDLVTINNTSNVHLNIMRPDVLTSLLDSVAYNFNRQQDSIRLFEFGRSYSKGEEGYQEDDVLVILASGMREPENWRKGKREEVDFYDVKQATDQVISRMQIQSGPLEEVEDEVLNPCWSLRKGPMEVYRIGEVSSTWRKEMGIKNRVFATRLYLSTADKMKGKSTTVAPVSKFPTVRRDLALVVDNSVTYDQIAGLIRKKGTGLLKEVNLFDVYENADQLGEGKRSYAVSMSYNHLERTLKDDEVDKIVQDLIAILGAKLGAEIRS